jgi:hypothetical protein
MVPLRRIHRLEQNKLARELHLALGIPRVTAEGLLHASGRERRDVLAELPGLGKVQVHDLLVESVVRVHGVVETAPDLLVGANLPERHPAGEGNALGDLDPADSRLR